MISQKIPENRLPCETARSCASCVAWLFCFRKKCGATPGLPVKFRRPHIPTGEPKSRRRTLDNLHEKLDVTYARYGDDRTLEMDIYRPKKTWGTLPAIVCIHGGGWAKGNRLNHARVAQALAARGYVAATISYRLSGEAQFPAQIHDCKAAVRFLRANANEYGIDSDRIGAIGLSAGGHLVALLATSNGVAGTRRRWWPCQIQQHDSGCRAHGCPDRFSCPNAPEKSPR